MNINIAIRIGIFTEDKKFKKTGWFYTAYDGKRWWLADPDGNAFFSTGIDCVHPGSDTRVDVMRNLCTWIPNKDSHFADACKVTKDSGRITSVNYGIANMFEEPGKVNSNVMEFRMDGDKRIYNFPKQSLTILRIK